MLKKGLTFLEIVMALFILSLALLGLLQMFNAALDSSFRANQEIIATNLSRGLMAEVMSKNFSDPEEPNNPLGKDTAETIRNTFDDVDDYNNHSESPPVTIGGAPMDGTGGAPDYSRFTRSVRVVYCNIVGNDIVEVSPGPTDYKKVTVTSSGPYVRDISIDEVKTK